jgi:hypothetical protein
VWHRPRKVSDRKMNMRKPLETYRYPLSVTVTGEPSSPGNNAWRVPGSWPSGVRYIGGMIRTQARPRNMGTRTYDIKGKPQAGQYPARANTNAVCGGGASRSSEEVSVMDVERRGRVISRSLRANSVTRRSS